MNPKIAAVRTVPVSSLARWAILLAVLCGFASATLITRTLLAHNEVEPDTLMALRYAISAAGTAGVTYFDRKRSRLTWHAGYLGGGALIATQAICFGMATKLTSASIAGLCFFGCASLTAAALGSWVQRELPRMHLYGMLLGLGGLLAVLRPTGNGNSLGTLLAVVGGCAWGAYLVWSKYLMPTDGVDLLRGTSRTMAIGSIFIGAFARIAEPHGLTTMDATAWWSVLYIGLLPQAIGLAVLTSLAARFNPVQLGVSLIGTPILVVLGGVTLLAEPSTWALWGGLSLVIAGMVLASKDASTPTNSGRSRARM